MLGMSHSMYSSQSGGNKNNLLSQKKKKKSGNKNKVNTYRKKKTPRTIQFWKRVEIQFFYEVLTSVYEPLMLNLFMTFVKLGKEEINDRATLSASGADKRSSSSLALLPVVASDTNFQNLDEKYDNRSI